MNRSASVQPVWGPVLHYAFADCSLGELLLVTSPEAICAIALGDTRGPLLASGRQDFPGVELRLTPAGATLFLEQVRALVDGQGDGQGLPLALAGTAFQRRVWSALADTAPGATLAYGALAARLGCPGAARAVAAACAANRLAVAVPCHRVIAADGALTGYRWGIERKRRLLARERGFTPAFATRP